MPEPSPAAVDGILRVVEFDGSADQLDIETRAAVGRLDPDAGTMVQAVLFVASDGPGRLLLIGHHLVVDGVSWRIILEDLARAGSAVAAGAFPNSLRSERRCAAGPSCSTSRRGRVPSTTNCPSGRTRRPRKTRSSVRVRSIPPSTSPVTPKPSR